MARRPIRTSLRKINHETEGETVERAGDHRGPPSSSRRQGKACKKRDQDALQRGRKKNLPFVWLPGLEENAHSV